ncbi:SDR family oxidoreductase [Pseudidiomarina donghaiensis]|uniref:Short chain dehydrogenase n=1 Tax=Pseudidiomarina donghaiensis TaxID=519452 RepID=A0A432XCK1_9GAMM|nr:SDR family oxidoreductase [Pseudidiomarina donghaiensis]RUO46479.1 short chain dehydrogenase [Pseudidiomarina donghaiensis]SFV24708.1 Short-chain dehydrogenase [Pseudidiomarina donghaiensis]
MPKLNWQQQHIILTGAAGGLGQSLVKALSERGAKVLLVGRNEAALQALGNAYQQSYYVLDLTTPDALAQLQAYVEQQRSTQRPVTGVINNAAINHAGLLSQQSAEHIHAVIQTNLTVPMQLTAALLPYLPQQRGWLLNMGSVFGSLGYPGQTLYCASKFGLRGFTEALHRELGAHGPKLMYCAPRAISTTFNDGITAELNERLHTHADSPAVVAAHVLRQIETQQTNVVIGWPERLFVWLNGWLPSVVASGMKKPQKLLYQLTQEQNK